MTGSDSVAPCAAHAFSEAEEKATVRLPQARLLDAMLDTFVHQLRLMHAMMVELPLGWLRSEGQVAHREIGAQPGVQADAIPAAAPSPNKKAGPPRAKSPAKTASRKKAAPHA